LKEIIRIVLSDCGGVWTGVACLQQVIHNKLTIMKVTKAKQQKHKVVHDATLLQL